MSNQKITQMEEILTLKNDNLIPIIDDVSTIPVNKKVSLNKIMAFPEVITVLIELAVDKEYTIDLEAEYKYDIEGVKVVSSSGTGNMTLEKTGVSIPNLTSIPISNVKTNIDLVPPERFVIGDSLKLILTDTSTLTDLVISIKTRRVL